MKDFVGGNGVDAGGARVEPGAEFEVGIKDKAGTNTDAEAGAWACAVFTAGIVPGAGGTIGVAEFRSNCEEGNRSIVGGGCGSTTGANSPELNSAEDCRTGRSTLP